MSGEDWMAILVLAGVLVLILCLDGLRRLEERRQERAARNADHRRLMDEVRRQP